MRCSEPLQRCHRRPGHSMDSGAADARGWGQWPGPRRWRGRLRRAAARRKDWRNEGRSELCSCWSYLQSAAAPTGPWVMWFEALRCRSGTMAAVRVGSGSARPMTQIDRPQNRTRPCRSVPGGIRPAGQGADDAHASMNANGLHGCRLCVLKRDHQIPSMALPGLPARSGAGMYALTPASPTRLGRPHKINCGISDITCGPFVCKVGGPKSSTPE